MAEGDDLSTGVHRASDVPAACRVCGRASTLLVFQLPNPVPVRRQSLATQDLDALPEHGSWSIRRHYAQTLSETLLGPTPVTGAIGGEPFCEQAAHFVLCSGKGPGWCHDLVHAHWLDLSGHGEEIDLAGLDVVLGELKSFFVDQNARLVCIIRPLQPRSKVDGVANHGERPRVCRPDRPNYQIAGGEPHSHAELRQIAAQAEDIG